MLSHHRHRGFSIIEVLIAVLLLNILIGGIASLQNNALRQAHHSQVRRAVILSTENFMTRIQANQASLDEYVNSTKAFTDEAHCLANTCNSTDIAHTDLLFFKQQMKALVGTNYGINIAYNPTGQELKLTVCWDEKDGIVASDCNNDPNLTHELVAWLGS